MKLDLGKKLVDSFENYEQMYKKIDRINHKKSKYRIRLKKPNGKEIVVPYKSLVDLMIDAANLHHFPWVGILNTVLLFMMFGMTCYNIWLMNKLIEVLSNVGY